MPFSIAQAVVSPGTFVETIVDRRAASLAGVSRIPFVVGWGEEEQLISDTRIARGSSAIADTLVYQEDLSDQIDAINGNRIFTVENFPIVSGDGTGKVTVDPNDVEVLLNGSRAALIALRGSVGEIEMAQIPQTGDTLTITYYYRRSDTLLTDQDMSDQANGTATAFRVPYVPIVSGDDSGTPTTDISKVTVTVDGSAVTVSEVDGQTGVITLAAAPAAGSVVLVTYYTNRWRNTFDEVSNTITSMVRVGNVVQREDYTNTIDYVAWGNRIYWGTVAFVDAGETLPGTTPFDEEIITVTTVDDKFYLEESQDWPEASKLVYRTQEVPVSGEGVDRNIDEAGSATPGAYLNSTIKAYEGPDPITALSNPLLITKVDAENRLVTLDTNPTVPTFAFGTVTMINMALLANGDGFTIDGKDFGIARRAVVNFTLNSNAALEGETFTLDDGVNGAKVFEFVDPITNPTYDIATTSDYPVPIGTLLADTSNNIAAAIVAASGESTLFVNVSQSAPTTEVSAVLGRDTTDFFDTGAAQITINSEYSGHEPVGVDYTVREQAGSGSISDEEATAQNAVEVINAADVRVTATYALGVITVTATIQSGNVIDLAVIGASGAVGVSGATLAGAVDNYVWFTYYRSFLRDDTYTLKVTRSGPYNPPLPVDIGEYTAKDKNNNDIRSVEVYDTLVNIADPNYPGVPAFPGMVPVLHTDPENGVDEVVTVTFTSATAFTVTSSDPVAGSSGTGYVGQTYYDARTGLTFTLADPQDSTNTTVLYNYAPGDVVAFRARTIHQVSLLSDWSFPGLRVTIQSTEDVAVNNEGTIYCFNKGGSEPDVGEFYYASYYYEKPDSAYEPQIFTEREEIPDNLGPETLANPIALASGLSFDNNNQLVGVLQIKRAEGADDLTDQQYIDAINNLLTIRLPGGFRVETITPLSDSASLHASLKQHVERQSSPVFAQERRMVVAPPLGTTPAQARDYASNLTSARCQYVYSGGGGMVIEITDSLGRAIEYVSPGYYTAAAYAGLDTAARYDVAEPMTRKELVGFKRAAGSITEVEANLCANNGVLVIDDLEPIQRVRWAVTTDFRFVETREANVQKIDDYVHVQQRNALDPFIGQKNLPRQRGKVQSAVDALYSRLMALEYISSYEGAKIFVDPADPTGLVVESTYIPVLGLNFITVINYLRIDS